MTKLTTIGQDMESLILSLQSEQIEKPNNGGRDVRMPLKDCVLLATLKVTVC